MFKFQLAEKLGKTVSEIESLMGPQEMLRWQIYYHREHWQTRVQTETDEGKSQAILSLILGKNG